MINLPIPHIEKLSKVIFLIFLIPGVWINSATAQTESPLFDEKYGKLLSQIFEKQIGLYEDEKLVELVDTIGQKLISHLDDNHFTYHFKILDLEEPNAFSLPGGYIYVTRGLLALSNSEDELAGVMGHEIIHAHNRHSYQQMKTGVFSGILQLPANIAAGYLGEDFGSIINAPFEVGKSLIMSGYSKKNEKEADIEGMKLAAETGYDPLALKKILKNIKISSEFTTGEAEKKSYFSNHPYTDKRLEYIGSFSTEKNASDQVPIFEKDNFLCLLDGLTMGKNPTNGLFIEDNHYLHPEKRISLVFPEDWEISNVSKAVLGMSKDEEAMLMLNLTPDSKSPEKASKEFISTMSSKDIDLLNSKALRINGQPAHLVTLKTVIEDRVMFFQNLWIQVDSVTYNLIGTGTEGYLDLLKKSALSFGKVSEKELAKVKIDVLQIVEAFEGENLDDMKKRVKTKTDLDYLQIINSIDKKEKLKDGQKIKLIVQKGYTER